MFTTILFCFVATTIAGLSGYYISLRYFRSAHAAKDRSGDFGTARGSVFAIMSGVLISEVLILITRTLSLFPAHTTGPAAFFSMIVGTFGGSLGLIRSAQVRPTNRETTITITPSSCNHKVSLAVGDSLTIVADRCDWTGVSFDVMSLQAAKYLLKAKRDKTQGTRLTKRFIATNPGAPTKLATVFEIMPDAKLPIAERLAAAKSTIVVVEVTVEARKSPRTP